MEIADDSNNTYRKRIVFFIHAHQEALRWVYNIVYKSKVRHISHLKMKQFLASFIFILFSVCHRLAELLEDTFTVSFAVQMLMVTIGMSVTLLQVRIYS